MQDGFGCILSKWGKSKSSEIFLPLITPRVQFVRLLGVAVVVWVGANIQLNYEAYYTVDTKLWRWLQKAIICYNYNITSYTTTNQLVIM